MKALILFPFVTCALVGAATGPQEATDADKLKGTWVVTEALPAADAGRLSTKWVFGDGKFTFVPKEGKKEETAFFKLDPSKKPKEMDIFVDADRKLIFVKGIYLLEGDTLKICFHFELFGISKTPTKFEGSGNQLLVVLKRQKN